MGNQNHPDPWVLDHEAKRGSWGTAQRSLTPVLTGFTMVLGRMRPGQLYITKGKERGKGRILEGIL